MMRLVVYGLLIIGCLTACKKEAATTVGNNDSTKQHDTLNGTYIQPYIGELSAQTDTLISINGRQYAIECLAAMDTLNKISYTVTGNRDGKTYKSIYNGYEATYTIGVKEIDVNHLFTKTFTKNEFKDIIGEDALAQAIIEPAGFLGYHKGFDAFMFGMNFMVPDSDVGDQCFIMISRDGRIIEKSYNTSYGGGGQDGKIEVPDDNSFVLTCAKILNTDGKFVDLIDGIRTIAHTKLINGHTILVIYDPAEDDEKENARLIDNYGKVLKTFTYKGYYDLLGYVVPGYFEATTGMYLMLDEQLGNIRVIPKDNPLATFTIPFKTLREKAAKTGHEVTFGIDTEVAKYTFAMDTITKAIRLIKEE